MNMLPSINRVIKGWQITGLHNPQVFFNRLGELLPFESVLVLEETCMASDVRTFILANHIAPKAAIRPGTLLPPSRMYHLELTLDVLSSLASLSANHATPEICDNIYAYWGQDMLLDWHDAFSLPFYVSEIVNLERIARFCCETGSQFEPLTSAITGCFDEQEKGTFYFN